MILTSTGAVLTNAHVVNNASNVTVRVVATGQTFPANIVSSDTTADVAVIQLLGASGLQTVHVADSNTVKVNDVVTGVGNALGLGGTPHSATGLVQELGKQISEVDDTGAIHVASGMIQMSAPIVPGYSGGPLYNANGLVVGMDSAGNSSTPAQSYAIPIDAALTVANQQAGGSGASQATPPPVAPGTTTPPVATGTTPPGGAGQTNAANPPALAGTTSGGTEWTTGSGAN